MTVWFGVTTLVSTCRRSLRRPVRQHVALAEVGPVDVVVLVRVADRGGVARLALVVAEQGQRVLVRHLPFAGIVLVFAAPEHADALDGAAHVFGPHRPQAFAHGQHVLVDRVEHGEARHHGVFELADAHHLGLARLAQRVVGDGLDGEALDARRGGEARAVDVVLGVAADLLAVALLGGDDRYAVDVEGDVVDALGAEVVEGLDEDFEVLAVDHHGVVVVGLDDARLRRLVGLDQDAARQVHHGGLVAVEVAGLGAEAQHLVDAAGGHLEVELVGRGGILAQGLVLGRGAGRADGVVERGGVTPTSGSLAWTWTTTPRPSVSSVTSPMAKPRASSSLMALTSGGWLRSRLTGMISLARCRPGRGR